MPGYMPDLIPDGVSLSLPSLKTFLGASFAIFLVLYITVSAVLVFHWRRYGMHSRSVILAEVVFGIVSLALAVFALLALSQL
jgi:hypothetical protein